MRRATAILPGQPLHAHPTPADLVRFLRRLRISHQVPMALVDGPCWEWRGARDDRGYGRFKFAGKAVWAHRFALQALAGSLLDGEEADHLCLNPRCCNPAHLVAKTPGANRSEANRRRARLAAPDPEQAGALEELVGAAYDPNAW